MKKLNKYKPNKTTLIILASILIISIIFGYIYVKTEKNIYIYDYSGYFEMWKSFGELLKNDVNKFIQEVILSIKINDYNCTSILPLIPFYLLIGHGRITYIVSMIIIYIVPVIIILSLFVQNNLIDKKYRTNISFLIVILYTFLYSKWWAPTLRGLPDIICLIPLLIAFTIWYKNSYSENNKKIIPVSIGVLTYLTFLGRRYFAFEIVSFYFSMFAIEFINFITSSNKKKTFLNEITNFTLSGTVFIIPLILIQFPLVKTILSSNYGNSYSAFQLPFFSHLVKLKNEFSIIVLFVAIIGLLMSIKNTKYRKTGLFSCINIVICMLLFGRVQAMGVHHYLTIAPWIYLLNAIGILGVIDFVKTKKIATLITLVTLTIYILNFMTTFILRNTIVPILTQEIKYVNLQYENYDNLINLVSDLETLISGQNAKFTVFASSDNFSDNLIQTVGGTEIDNKIVFNSAIDLRDGLNYNSMLSEYAIATNIAQTGVSKDGQRIVSVPNNMVYNNYGIGKAYKKVLGPYKLQSGVEACIYQKTRAFTEKEVDEYINELKSYHKEWKKAFTILDKVLLMSGRHLGEFGGNIFIKNNKKIYITPGEKNTYLALPLNNKFKKIILSSIIEGDIPTEKEEEINTKIEIYLDENLITNQIIKTKNLEKIKLDTTNKKWLFISIDKGQKLSYDFLTLNIEKIEYFD